MFTIVALLLVFSTSALSNKPHFFSTFDENELARRLFGGPTIQTSVKFLVFAWSIVFYLFRLHSSNSLDGYSLSGSYQTAKILGRVYCKQLQQQT